MRVVGVESSEAIEGKWRTAGRLFELSTNQRFRKTTTSSLTFRLSRLLRAHARYSTISTNALDPTPSLGKKDMNLRFFPLRNCSRSFDEQDASPYTRSSSCSLPDASRRHKLRADPSRESSIKFSSSVSCRRRRSKTKRSYRRCRLRGEEEEANERGTESL